MDSARARVQQLELEIAESERMIAALSDRVPAAREVIEVIIVRERPRISRGGDKW